MLTKKVALGFFALSLLHAVQPPVRRAGLAGHGATLVLVPQQGGTARLRGTGAWGWLAWERAMKLLVSHAPVHPLLCRGNARGALLITALSPLMPLAVFSTSVGWLTLLGKHANSDPLGRAAPDREIGELSTQAGSESGKKTKEQTSKPMTRKD